MEKHSIEVGMLVTCKKRVEAYGSGYPKGHPTCFFEPGDIGRVVAREVPYVVRREETFACVDFHKAGNMCNRHHWQEWGDTPWRVGIDYRTLRQLSSKERKEHPYHSLTIEVGEPYKARIVAEFPYQCADTCVEETSRVVVRLLHPISLWQVYWLGMQRGKGTIGSWYTLENEMPR